MLKQKQLHLFSPLFLLFLLFNVNFSAASAISGEITAKENPFTPKAYLLRYWDKEIRTNLPKSAFLLSKASPLNAVDSTNFAKLAAQNTLSSVLPSFCSTAKLFCFPDLSPSLEKHDTNANFAVYLNKNFTNYGTLRPGGVDSFKNYSDGDNLPTRASTPTAPAQPVAAVISRATTRDVNVPNIRFTTYTADAVGRTNKFTTYTDNANAGNQDFTAYGKKSNGSPNVFSSYGKGSNVMGSGFSGYGERGNGANDTFTSYGDDGNVPTNKFNNYGDGGNAAVESFSSYRDQSNVGDDSFQSYAKNSNSAKVKFSNYGNSFNEGTDVFKGYGQGAKGHTVGFKTYGVNNTFKDYAKTGVTFAKYNNVSSSTSPKMAATSGSLVNRWVEPGKFFRESMLKKGNVMPMPDIKDKMPKRSFLPRTIVSKLPFSSSKVSQLKQLFHAADNSTMETIIKDTLSECERAPSAGETKRCVGSVEDMIDFATSILGRNVVVRSTENLNGSKKKIMVGSIKGINGGKVTKSVSCHQSLFPYLLYYCHSVPKVRVYKADILDPNTKAKINHGVAICHLDTSAWSPTHGAFLALGSGPGRIEVCHWIFENDMTWTTAD
ncbi:hypothetical protein Patl1_16139 [Pistacia atlantica]|uniref:Uncharacterized protein n=1 Tax=Pistacia atlantica TaxID=434234 RepID=A0ACC1B914_9ROSI|nr:hypothetical protein Patl1_16139 [Pistacia atlantica]